MALNNPIPAEIRQAREKAGLTQPAAADLLHVTPRAWKMWEAGDRKMHPAFWELLTIKLKRVKK